MFSTALDTGVALTTEPHTQVTIDPFGRVVIEGKNYTGGACTLLGEALRRAVGGGRGDASDPKPEMYDTGTVEQTQNRW